MQQGETEVWKAARYAKFEGKIGTIQIPCPSTLQSCMIILPIFNALNSAVYVMKKSKICLELYAADILPYPLLQSKEQH